MPELAGVVSIWQQLALQVTGEPSKSVSTRAFARFLRPVHHALDRFTFCLKSETSCGDVFASLQKVFEAVAGIPSGRLAPS
jgi:hypothetical protein